jgi:hypothetical protein
VRMGRTEKITVSKAKQLLSFRWFLGEVTIPDSLANVRECTFCKFYYKQSMISFECRHPKHPLKVCMRCSTNFQVDQKVRECRDAV